VRKPEGTVSEAAIISARNEDGGSKMTQPQPTILVADDDSAFLDLVSRELRGRGYATVEATSGEDALTLALSRNFDLAILDVKMPGITGIELAQQLRERTAIPVVFLSAQGNTDIVRKAAEHGAFGYMVKPMDIEQILPMVESALQRAIEMSRLRQSEQQLKQALVHARQTSMAIGVLMERNRLERDGAFNALRELARTRRAKIHDQAEEILAAVEVLNWRKS